jgi:hypothetical protein
MNSHADEGLFVSVLIYFMALLFGLALFVGPVLWANGPTVEKNIAPDNARELLASRYNRYSDSQYPIAKLKRQELLNSGPTVEMNARVKEAQNVRPSRHAPDRARHTQKIRQAQIPHSRATPPQRQYHISSSALSAQY